MDCNGERKNHFGTNRCGNSNLTAQVIDAEIGRRRDYFIISHEIAELVSNKASDQGEKKTKKESVMATILEKYPSVPRNAEN